MSLSANLLADIEGAIRRRNIPAIISLFFPGATPDLTPGLRVETDLWDYKSDCPRPNQASENAWAHLAKDVLAFHNNRGGVIFFGIDDNTFTFRGATHRLDSKIVNDQLRRFLGDRLWIEYLREFIMPDQKYLGVAVIPPRGPSIIRFTRDAPVVNGSQLFRRDESSIRRGDSSVHLSAVDIELEMRKMVATAVGQVYCVDEPYYRILAPEYREFVIRDEICAQIEAALTDPRTSVTSITGIGGMGKTALATWATMRAHQRGTFDVIVSMTAKDRELTSHGIRAINPTMGSYDNLLNSVLEVSGFADLKMAVDDEKQRHVRDILLNSNALLYVDNLETVDDKRIIEFLDDLPLGCHAITTSRRGTVRVSVRPIDVSPMAPGELVRFARMLSRQPGFTYVADMQDAELMQIGTSCNGIPLAIHWVLGRASSAAEALAQAEGITNARHSGEQLLEFTFRRVFDSMSPAEKQLLRVLSIFERPLPNEALMIGGNLAANEMNDAIEALIRDSLVHRLFDAEINDYTFSVIPVTRAFVYSDIARNAKQEGEIRRRLRDYFDAMDVRDENQRVIIRNIRRGNEASDQPLIDLAQSADRRGDLKEAEELYRQALQRNPRSWKAARQFAEFCRHKLQRTRDALTYYEQAAANAPRDGFERALIFREWGILLRQSGSPEAADLAAEKLEIAVAARPNDHIAITALAQVLERKGQYRRVIELLSDLSMTATGKTRDLVLPMLLNAYEQVGDMVNAAITRAKIQ